MWRNFNFKWFVTPRIRKNVNFSNYTVVFGVKIFVTTFLFLFFGVGVGRKVTLISWMLFLLLLTAILSFSIQHFLFCDIVNFFSVGLNTNKGFICEYTHTRCFKNIYWSMMWIKRTRVEEHHYIWLWF